MAFRVVHKVAVILDESSSWHSLKSKYNEYKELLTSKYGKGTSFEFFSDPYYEEMDMNSELSEMTNVLIQLSLKQLMVILLFPLLMQESLLPHLAIWTK